MLTFVLGKCCSTRVHSPTGRFPGVVSMCLSMLHSLSVLVSFLGPCHVGNVRSQEFLVQFDLSTVAVDGITDTCLT